MSQRMVCLPIHLSYMYISPLAVCVGGAWGGVGVGGGGGGGWGGMARRGGGDYTDHTTVTLYFNGG
jgi:hypothetical protein